MVVEQWVLFYLSKATNIVRGTLTKSIPATNIIHSSRAAGTTFSSSTRVTESLQHCIQRAWRELQARACKRTKLAPCLLFIRVPAPNLGGTAYAGKEYKCVSVKVVYSRERTQEQVKIWLPVMRVLTLYVVQCCWKHYPYFTLILAVTVIGTTRFGCFGMFCFQCKWFFVSASEYK